MYVLAAPGVLGADLCRELGIAFRDLDLVVAGSQTTRDDTTRAVTRMLECGVDLVMFAGGDGTARDILGVTGRHTPILGVPAGVKMRSSVFAISPEAAGSTAATFLSGDRRVGEADVVDVVTDASGNAVSHHFGTAMVPASSGGIQRAKAASASDEDAQLDALCRDIAECLDPSTLYLFGPGSTTKRILTALDQTGTPMGVDATRGREPIGRDLSEGQILALLSGDLRAVLFLGVLGGQGFLLGRGNQQISPAVIELVGEENVVILASEAKLACLNPAVLWMDVGDERGEHPLPGGYRRVRTGPHREMVVLLAHSGDQKEFGRAV